MPSRSQAVKTVERIDIEAQRFLERPDVALIGATNIRCTTFQ